MAGREVSGAAGARSDLMDNRWWILTPTPQTGAAHLEVTRQLAVTCGAYPMLMSPHEHDQAVALVSHAPQLVASSLAAQLLGAREDFVRICGQGLRDTTRIAGSDSSLWTDILAANARPVADVLAGVIQTLSTTLQGLEAADHGVPEGVSAITRTLETGSAGRARIPGKHGADALEFAEVAVMVEDRPGELARLFVAAGEVGINLEDVRIEHVLGRPSGLVELSVRHEYAVPLSSALRERGFDLRSETVAGA
jgi:prephenate dehydrogenase